MITRQRIRMGALATASLSLAGVLVAPAASADDPPPTTRELLEQCNQGNTDVCDFHPEGNPEVYRGEYQLAGGATNCTPDPITREVWWAWTQSTTNTVGVKMNAQSTIGKAFTLGFESSYSHEWMWQETKNDKVTPTVGPNRGVNILAAPMRQKVRGSYEIHFPERYKGHYIWHTGDVEVDGPASQSSWDTRVESSKPSC